MAILIPKLSFNEVPLPSPLSVAPCQCKDFCVLYTFLLPLSIVSVVEICFGMFMQLVIVRNGD